MIQFIYAGKNYWGNDIYRNNKKKYAVWLEEEQSLYWCLPTKDPEGEPAFPVSEDYSIKKNSKKEIKDREEYKFILAKMIAANEYKEGITSIQWLDHAAGINQLKLTKQLLHELKEQPIELVFTTNGYVGKLQAEAKKVLERWTINSDDKQFCYMLLDRLRLDCECFLSCDTGNEKILWAHNIKEQIEIMKALYNSFYNWDVPEWIHMSEIKMYESFLYTLNKPRD